MPITSLSRQAWQILAAHPHLEIHSVFRSSVNLRAGRQLITCTADAVHAPHGVEMAPADLVIPAITRPLVFDPTIPLVSTDKVHGQLLQLMELLDRTKPATGLGDQWLALTADTRLTRAVGSILDYAVDEPLLYWIGRGPGLTPSGDDFLVGMIAALWCAGAWPREHYAIC